MSALLDNRTLKDAGPGVEDDPHGRGAPSEAGPPGLFATTTVLFQHLHFASMPYLDVDGFFISPFVHFETFDVGLIELWAEAYSRIVRELVSAVVSHDGDFRSSSTVVCWNGWVRFTAGGTYAGPPRARFKQFFVGDFHLAAAACVAPRLQQVSSERHPVEMDISALHKLLFENQSHARSAALQ